MESLHRYLVARYDISDYDYYLKLLAMYRNTAAIEAQNSHIRHASLSMLFQRCSEMHAATVKRIRERKSSTGLPAGDPTKHAT